jgi:hypothetical protein
MEYVTQEQFQAVVNELLEQILKLKDNLREESDSLHMVFNSEVNVLRLEMYDMRSDLEREIGYLERKCENE